MSVFWYFSIVSQSHCIVSCKRSHNLQHFKLCCSHAYNHIKNHRQADRHRMHQVKLNGLTFEYSSSVFGLSTSSFRHANEESYTRNCMHAVKEASMRENEKYWTHEGERKRDGNERKRQNK